MAGISPEDLQHRIDMLKGQIRHYKQTGSLQDQAHRPSKSPSRRSKYGRQPYPQHHENPAARTFKNRTLVLGNATNSVTLSTPNTLLSAEIDPEKTSDSSTWISTPSRNAQIINAKAYQPMKSAVHSLDPIAQLRKQSQVIRRELNSDKLRDRQIVVEGIPYSVHAGGSKLVRIKGEVEGVITPKQVTISGLSFLRSKNGNLYRKSVVKRQKNTTITKAKSGLCARFTRTGRCSNNCTFIHDPQKVAVCREFFKSGSCSQGQHCDLSHDLTYERVPACVHFLRGACTRSNCPYPHVNFNPSANICRAFTTLGYCSKGVDCQDKHVIECPDYAEGKCYNDKCRLPHIDRAGQLKQQSVVDVDHTLDAAQSISENQTPFDSASDIDSEDDIMMDETSFSQEQDFLRL